MERDALYRVVYPILANNDGLCMDDRGDRELLACELTDEIMIMMKGVSNVQDNDPRPHDLSSVHHFWHPSETMVKAKLIKNAGGKYSWEITAEAKTPEELVKIMEDTEGHMIGIWGEQS